MENNIPNIYIVYGIKSIDLKDPNVKKIGSCKIWKDRRSTYITGYPYNHPKPIFVITDISGLIILVESNRPPIPTSIIAISTF